MNNFLFSENIKPISIKPSSDTTARKIQTGIKFYVSGGIFLGYVGFYYLDVELDRHYYLYSHQYLYTNPSAYSNLLSRDSMNKGYYYTTLNIDFDIQYRGVILRTSLSKFLFSLSPYLKNIGPYGLLVPRIWIGYSNRYKNKNWFVSVFWRPFLLSAIIGNGILLAEDGPYYFSSYPTNVKLYPAQFNFIMVSGEFGWKIKKKCYLSLYFYAEAPISAECGGGKGDPTPPHCLGAQKTYTGIKFYYLLNKMK